jgi:large subunit ribosomal protein LP1
LAKVIKASGNEVEPYWPSLFAKALKGQNIEELLSNIGSAPVAVAGGVQAAAGGAAPAEKAAEKGKSILTFLIIFCV